MWVQGEIRFWQQCRCVIRLSKSGTEIKQNRLRSGSYSNEKADNPNQKVDKKQRPRINLRNKSRSVLAEAERQEVREIKFES